MGKAPVLPPPFAAARPPRVVTFTTHPRYLNALSPSLATLPSQELRSSEATYPHCPPLASPHLSLRPPCQVILQQRPTGLPVTVRCWCGGDITGSPFALPAGGVRLLDPSLGDVEGGKIGTYPDSILGFLLDQICTSGSEVTHRSWLI
jgi:hypothetical protein